MSVGVTPGLSDFARTAWRAAAETGRPLLDAVTVRHGPKAELGRFFLAADEDARHLGVTVLLHADMRSMLAVNAALRPIWDFPVFPVFNPDLHALGSDNAFWLSGHDENGSVVATQASRLIDMAGTTALDELRSQRLLYSDPAPEIAAGATVLVEGDAVAAAATVGGHVIFNGGAWHDRSVRGRGLSQILPRIARTLAYTRWAPETCITLIETVLALKRVHRRYGYYHHAPVVRVSGRHRTVDTHFAWIPGPQILGDLMGYVAARAGVAVPTGIERRMVEEDDTNRSPRLSHGSSSRS